MRTVGAALLLVVLGSGCRPREVERPPGAIVVALQADARTLDPHRATDAASMRVLENVYSTLLRYAPAYGELEPDLATSFTISDDARTYTFALRPNARFHSGRAVTSADVKFSVERIVAARVRADQFSAIERIDTPDPHIVVFQLREPFAPFLTALAHPMNAVVDRDRAATLGAHDGGSGPFVIRTWDRDRRLIVDRFPGYYLEGRPRLAGIVYRPIPDESARATALRTNEVQLVLDVSARDAELLGRADGVVVAATPGTFWEYVGLNTARPPLNDVRVRRALALAIDRERVDRLVKLGRAAVAEGGPIPALHWAHADLHLYRGRALERARALLAEAGLGHGFELTLSVGADFPYQVNAAQVVKQQLGELGVKVRIVMQESGLFFDSLARHDFDATLVGWVGFVDPDEWTFNLFHSRGRYNQQRYANAAVDALLEKGRATADREARRAIYADAQRIIAEEAPVASLYIDAQVSAHRRALKGFTVHPTATTIALRDAELAE